MQNKPHRIIALLLMIFHMTPTAASNEIEELLRENQAPPGIVFEIVSDELDLLNDLLPELRRDIMRIRDRFPDLPIAIVTHGSEQFALKSDNSKTDKVAHETVQKLVRSDQVDVHVCGTHASWFGVSPEDFPDYVDVSPTGPAQINDYENLGYEIIVLP